MVDPSLKLVKALESQGFFLTPTQGARWVLKILYEYWGFVVNGGTDPLTPAGFAVSGGINLPALVLSGVIASANDGATSFGSNTLFSPSTNFTSLNVSGSLLNKYVVMWKSSSTSFDDGIYKIEYVDSTNRIILDTSTGGTPRLGNKPVFWDRDGICFRIVDVAGTTNASGWNSTQGLTFQFNGASDVNPGQSLSQFNLTLQTLPNIGDLGLMSMSISPSGSWNGTSFVDSGSSSNQVLFPASPSGRLVCSIAGGKDFLACHINGIDGTVNGTTNPTGFHVEIPKRLYPKQNDPNPITFMVWDSTVPLSQVSGSYNTGFRMIGADGVLRLWTTLVRAPMGSFTNTTFVSQSLGVWQGIDSNSYLQGLDLNLHTNKRLITDAVLHLNQSGEFSFARCRLRRVRFTTQSTPTGTRFGTDWIHMISGILWPWNNTVIPMGTLLWESQTG